MEPIDTDMEVMVREPRQATPGSRLNALLLLPVLGVLLMLFFILAAIFQFDITALVDSIMGLMMLFFIVLVVMLFWAMATRTNKA
ncbi:MAG TPA: hypothetical protein DDW33_02760 [Ktedonobacter sp.]|jgi:hypothetical protein|nr:hypothetical protein [Ktedonobacter sp.]HAH00543.1 hypothetical protein [Ktedonobacter sp.]HAT46092.1 hypothetical protein [Ktedonobacter sp.]HBE24594.1 hypothetical protein [Ktedonobacter sp.]HCF85766.1 hypothetical protein [Ktedonobacter sp.]